MNQVYDVNTNSTVQSLDLNQNSKGPLKKFKQFFLLIRLTFVLMKGRLFKLLKTSNKTASLNITRKKKTGLSKFSSYVGSQITSPRFIARMVLIVFSLYFVRRMHSFYKSMVTEISYSSFLRLITSTPERISDLQITPTSFTFFLDGRAAFSRNVALSPTMVDKLMAAGIEFSSAASPLNILGIIFLFYNYIIS
jgi:hypothetical protein